MKDYKGDLECPLDYFFSPKMRMDSSKMDMFLGEKGNTCQFNIRFGLVYINIIEKKLEHKYEKKSHIMLYNVQ